YQVAVQLVERAVRTVFVKYFPSPEKSKKRTATEEKTESSPDAAILAWFDEGNHLDVLQSMTDKQKIHALKKVTGLEKLVRSVYPSVGEQEAALLMEFVLNGLSSYSVISKQILQGKVVFQDIMGGMMNFSSQETDD
ncbi:MAG: magnesium chelatase, partial [Bacteroidota bacterium]